MLVGARKLERCDGTDFPGWYVEVGTNWYGPIATRADTIYHMRTELSKIKNRYWKQKE